MTQIIMKMCRPTLCVPFFEPSVHYSVVPIGLHHYEKSSDSNHCHGTGNITAQHTQVIRRCSQSDDIDVCRPCNGSHYKWKTRRKSLTVWLFEETMRLSEWKEWKEIKKTHTQIHMCGSTVSSVQTSVFIFLSSQSFGSRLWVFDLAHETQCRRCRRWMCGNGTFPIHNNLLAHVSPPRRTSQFAGLTCRFSCRTLSFPRARFASLIHRVSCLC